MPERYCCAECFGDDHLRENVIPDNSPRSGVCDYCESNVSSLIKPAVLREAFEALIDIYDIVDDGLTLPAILRRDWGLFSTDLMRSDAYAKDLLSDVLDNGDLLRKSFEPSPDYQAKSLADWDDLRDEMMHENRWFLKEEINYLRLGELLDYLITDASLLSDNWYRARIMNDEGLYPLDKMGAPPSNQAGHGRANPAGIPYLYLGSTPTTAIAEIRPHTGAAACVAEFALPSIRAVDLRAPRARISPFALDDGEIGQVHADLPLLVRLGEELTRPVLPKGAPYEYIPSQHLCEYIKSQGFDGVIYNSSVSRGINVALFHPDVATGVQVSPYIVDRVEVVASPRP